MKIIIAIVSSFFIINLYGQQSLDKDINENRNALNKIKNEINSLRKTITKTDIKATSALEQIKFIEKELKLISDAKYLLDKEIKLLTKKVNQARSELGKNNEKLDKLRTEYTKRITHLYKFGRIHNLELLLNSQSLNQSIVRYKYLKLFSDQEVKLVNKIKSSLEEIKLLENKISSDLKRQSKSLKEKEKEQANYLTKKEDKRVLVHKLNWTSKNLSNRLKDAEEEYQKLYQIIINLEKQRKLREQKGEQRDDYALNLKNFNKAKGKLPWPVKGKIIHKYGKQYNATLKTTINNTGIDIQAKSGAEVKSIFTGIVSIVTYISGFGNTVILDHGEGYYSVYAHLDEIYTGKDELAEAGNVIGLVGDSGSLEGSKLHFEIYANQKTENPLQWLR